MSARPAIVYASFDPFPAPKGAAVHIARAAAALTRVASGVTLVTLPPVPGWEERARPPACEHVALAAPGRTLIDRVLAFRRALLRWWGDRRVDVLHVRSIHEAYPLVRRGDACARLVYEVNGLPSIELKYHYPDVADDRDLLAKLVAQEDAVLRAADLVVTPSPVTAAHLRGRGVPAARLRVVPNGVDPEAWCWAPPRPAGDRPLELLYAGTLTGWQGVDLAIEALALYRRDRPAALTLVGPGRRRQRERLLDLARRLGVREHVRLLPPAAGPELVRLHHAADVALAPLRPNDRNLRQGCCPLKVLEAMASGTPLVASDLPAVRALARPDEEALLVRPGSAKAIKDALLRLADEPDLAQRVSGAARARVEAELTWDRSDDLLLAAYREVLAVGSSPE